ncbi:MAG: 50S ribosomal protein L4, partial [Patescibacteria group bacterium]
MPTKSTTKNTLAVFDLSGKKSTKTVTLPQDIFGSKASDILLAKYVRVYLANKRSWSAVTKTRAEVTASTRKIYRQKGTGRARHGALTAPLFVGGGTTHGPKGIGRKLKLNKKQIKQALFGALSKINQNNNLFILSDVVL